METLREPLCGKRLVKRSSIALACALLAATAIAGTALAGSYVIRGELNTGGYLVRYQVWRTKSFTGPATMRLFDNTANFTRLGLRNLAGTQFTHTYQWDVVPVTHQFVQLNGSINIPAGTRFAFNGRMGATSPLADRTWAGHFTY